MRPVQLRLLVERQLRLLVELQLRLVHVRLGLVAVGRNLVLGLVARFGELILELVSILG